MHVAHRDRKRHRDDTGAGALDGGVGLRPRLLQAPVCLGLGLRAEPVRLGTGFGENALGLLPVAPDRRERLLAGACDLLLSGGTDGRSVLPGARRFLFRLGPDRRRGFSRGPQDRCDLIAQLAEGIPPGAGLEPRR
ncbi:MAG: hypothetical protein C4289_11995 [Chloroflexota bacterium]